MVENRQDYNELLQMIRNMGPLREIIRSEYMLKNIISYNGDRHLICALFDEVNAALENRTITEDDLAVLRSGVLMDMIVNLEKTVQETAPRPLFLSERLDKVNYVSLINDPQTLASCFTHPDILAAISGENYNRDLAYWVEAGTFSSQLPSNVRSLIINEVLKKGNIEVAQRLLEQTSYGVKTLEQMEENIKTY